MTAAELLAWIVAGILLQFIAGIAWAVWRSLAQFAQSSGIVSEQSENARAAWVGWREFRVVQRQFEDAAQAQCSFYLAPVDGQLLPTFAPGQFLTFALALPDAASKSSAARTITRCYSLSMPPDPHAYRITVKRVAQPPGVVSNYLHDHVQVGDVLRVKAPAGRFVIDADETPLVLIAGGIGITPLLSMLLWYAAKQPTRAVHLFYGVRNGREHAFKHTLQTLATTHPSVRVHMVYSRPDADDVAGRDYQHAGHIDIALLRDTLMHTLNDGSHTFYLCGPPAMMQTLVPALATCGVPANNIHFEAFGPAGLSLLANTQAAANTVVESDVEFDITFRRSGCTLRWNGSDVSLLEFAERHHIAVEFGCRSGNCGSCATEVVRGTVRYAHTPDADIAANHCLLCVGRPASALVLEA